MWGVLEAALAIVLLVASTDGLQMLQTISIVAAFPFTFIMIGSMVAIYKMAKTDHAMMPSTKTIKKSEEIDRVVEKEPSPV
jgi:Choline-glycine betaine transporter